MAIFYLLISALAFTVLGVSYKLSDRLKCDDRQVNLCMFITGAIIILVWAWRTGCLVPHKPAMAAGTAMGAMILAAVWAFRKAVAKGGIAASWTILQLSMIVPVSASILFWHETLSPRVGLGLALVAAAIVLLGIDLGRRTE
ncbi:MAG: hypothetical protein Q7T82_11245 [Armatimonadota bacterium]|nr:hypothetical protein [Armatimonadota bacterium]